MLSEVDSEEETLPLEIEERRPEQLQVVVAPEVVELYQCTQVQYTEALSTANIVCHKHHRIVLDNFIQQLKLQLHH